MKNRCLPNLETVFQAVLIPHQAIFVQSVHAAQNVPFSIFMFTVGNEAFYVALPVFPSPAAQVPPQAARQVQTP